MRMEHDGLRMTLERTAPGGCGPTTGSAESEANKEPGDGEQRSTDDRAVPPGEAEAWALNWLREYCQRASANAADAPEKWGIPRRSAFGFLTVGERCAYDQIAGIIATLMPEPDSDADDPCPDRKP